jgi:hypothetical protein
LRGERKTSDAKASAASGKARVRRWVSVNGRQRDEMEAGARWRGTEKHVK